MTKKATGLGVSKEVLDLIDKMLIKEPDYRIALLDVLHHPWIMGAQELYVETDPDLNNREEEEENDLTPLVKASDIKIDVKPIISGINRSQLKFASSLQVVIEDKF